MLHFFGEPRDFSGFSGLRGTDVADMVSGQILFDQGPLMQGVWSFGAVASEVVDKCTLSGSSGSIEFPFFDNRLAVIVDGARQVFEYCNPEHVQMPLIDKVVRYFQGKAENPCTGQDGLRVMEIIDTFTSPG